MKKLISLLVVSLLVCSFGMCKAEDVKPMPGPIGPPDKVYPEPIVTGTIALTEGWNLIAMPVLPAYPYTVEQFIAAVEHPRFDGNIKYSQEEIKLMPRIEWEVPVVAVYKNGRFESYTKEGVTYNMVPGEAYFVYAKYHGIMPLRPVPIDGDYIPWHPSTTVTIAGKPLDTPVSLNLNRGWSGVSIAPLIKAPVAIESGDFIIERSFFTLNQLSEELTAQSIKATRIVFWNVYNQEWEQYELPYKMPISDPWTFVRIKVIRPDEGFFLLCEENGLYIPMLNTEVTPEPPIPPFPPKPPIVEERVSYTGKISGIAYLMFGPPPPFTHVIETSANERVCLKGIDESIEGLLQEAAKDEGNIRYVEGVMTTMLNFNGNPYGPGTPVEILLVDTVQMVGQLH